jgi:DNA-binding NarL/FixJ family response regulator
MIKILVVDDHPIVRQGLVGVLEDEVGFTVIGAVPSAEEALTFVARNSPDLILLDLELPGMDGIVALPRLLEASPGSRVIVFTAYETDERVFGAIRAGAKGYLLKGASTEEISRAIRAVHDGGSHLEPRVAARVLSELHTPRRSSDTLSEREREVLRLVADGLSNKEIGRALTISERTARFHVTSILNKLGANTRAQAVAVAGQRGLL